MALAAAGTQRELWLGGANGSELAFNAETLCVSACASTARMGRPGV